MKLRNSIWVAGLSSALMLLVSCHGNQASLNSSGIQAERIERLWWIIFGIIVAVYVIVIAWCGGALYRSRTTEPVSTVPP